ncbi:ankyrin repeat domain-containing protein [Sphingomonas sp. H160509]|uniref:ankyrin repeat domain-containing protein n=1 Tax=Sphingomonas sp. H160509 TaxID=2955313 RepID=UPI00406CC03C
MRIRLMLAATLLTPALACVAAPAFAQGQSEGYKFLSAVRDAKNNDVLEMLGKPGSNIINTRDVTSGEGALHIVIKRSDEVYLRFLLQKGADANLRDGKGNTPLLLAVTLGQTNMIPILTAAGGEPEPGQFGRRDTVDPRGAAPRRGHDPGAAGRERRPRPGGHHGGHVRPRLCQAGWTQPDREQAAGRCAEEGAQGGFGPEVLSWSYGRQRRQDHDRLPSLEGRGWGWVGPLVTRP